MKHTAQNTPFLASAKRAWNAKIYQQCLAQYNTNGQEAAANYLQQFSLAPIESATIAPPQAQ